MSASRRDDVAQVRVETDTHAGLWLDKYLAAQGDDQSKKNLVNEIAERIRTPDAYEVFYNRWNKALKESGAKMREARVKGRLAIGLGAEGVLETSISLHHTYGVPYIPGSALKGLAASYAHQHLEGNEWRKDTGWAYKELFGTTEQAGCVTFYDVLYIPDSGVEHRALWPDVITVHHPKYYRGEDVPPADWDSPTPIPFLTATGKFLIALAGQEEWIQVAFQILGEALYREGIGAKTNSGYGRLLLEGYTPSQTLPSTKSQPSARPTSDIKPSNDWHWRKGKMSKNRRYVIDGEDPEKRYQVNPKQILPKGYTPAGRSEVDFVIVVLENGEQSVWVKQRFYRIPD